MAKVADYDVAQQLFAAADALRPAGRPGRLDGLFASPTLAGMARWAKANRICRLPDAPHRLTVDGEVWLYRVSAWDRVGVSGSLNEDGRLTPRGLAAVEDYWLTGMRLEAWQAAHEADPRAYCGREWEALVAPEQIRSSRPIAIRTLIEGAEEADARALMFQHRPRLATRGVVWGHERRNDQVPALAS